jgi:hypothetical protein
VTSMLNRLSKAERTKLNLKGGMLSKLQRQLTEAEHEAARRAPLITTCARCGMYHDGDLDSGAIWWRKHAQECVKR